MSELKNYSEWIKDHRIILIIKDPNLKLNDLEKVLLNTSPSDNTFILLIFMIAKNNHILDKNFMKLLLEKYPDYSLVFLFLQSCLLKESITYSHLDNCNLFNTKDINYQRTVAVVFSFRLYIKDNYDFTMCKLPFIDYNLVVKTAALLDYNFNNFFINNNDVMKTIIRSCNISMIEKLVNHVDFKTCLDEVFPSINNAEILDLFKNSDILYPYISKFMPIRWHVNIDIQDDNIFNKVISKFSVMEPITLAYYLGLNIFEQEITDDQIQERFYLLQKLGIEDYISKYVAVSAIYDFEDVINNINTLGDNIDHLNYIDVIFLSKEKVVLSRNEWDFCLEKDVNPYTLLKLHTLSRSKLLFYNNAAKEFENMLPEVVPAVEQYYNCIKVVKPSKPKPTMLESLNSDLMADNNDIRRLRYLLRI